MTDKFVALPVRQGDAFFLQRGKFTALVDGGRSVHAFPTLFTQVLNRKSAAVLACTHNDADHANGILGYLESGLGCEEVWLPALWADRLQDLVEEPNAFLEELVDDIDRLADRLRYLKDDGQTISLEQVGDHFADDFERESRDIEVFGESQPGIPLDAMVLIMQTDRNGHDDLLWPETLGRRRLRVATSPFRIWTFEDEEYHLFLQAISAAERIRQIAVACAHRGVPVRWFEYAGAEARGGRPDLLIPLNGVEVAPPRPRALAALKYIALSVADRLSLAYCSPSDDGNPGIIVTADSDLQFSAPIPWHGGMIVTASHHGDEAGAGAYRRLKLNTNGDSGVTWVRSDGNFMTRPGPSFLDQTTRFCTLCRGTGRPKQALRFTIREGHWRPVASYRCLCH